MEASESPKKEQPESQNDDGLPPISPDFFEQLGTLDDAVPTRGYEMTPMVGLGGSAGSIQAMSAFFEMMPPDTGMIFVVVLHLSPTHESSMVELLARTTSMKVQHAADGLTVEANNVYVIPPGKYLVTTDGHLQLDEIENERGKRVAVDLFFRSLADTHGPHGMAIILSGADGDGALGIKRIKERGGLTIAQDPEEAEYPGMPRTAIETGMVDWVLEVSQMPGRLIEYRDNERQLELPPEDGPQPVLTKPAQRDDVESALRDVLVFLKTRTGRDFSYYKRATILRRIGRRMQVNGVSDLTGYLNFLRTHPGESGALLQDLLISVTNFFRDRDAFEALERLIPDLFENKSQIDAVRVWVPACATGEEAYSMAMLLLEHAQTIDSPPALQVFACDLDDTAIQYARAGHYPETITADVSEERLRKFFVKDHRGYHVRRELREMVLFAPHDLLKDAPFSRMDLISCRNLLIYLCREAQQRVFETFHFALKPNGLMFLGASETVDDNTSLFRVINKRHRIYASQPSARAGVPVPTGPSALRRAIDMQDQNKLGPVVHGRRFGQEAAVPFYHELGHGLDRTALSEIHFRLLERIGPPSVVVNADHDVIHLSENAGQFLKITGGEPTMNLMRIVHPALRLEVRATLFRAMESNGTVQSLEVPAEIENQPALVRVRVTPAHEIAPGYLLVAFDMRASDARPADVEEGTEQAPSEPVSRHLERELVQIKYNLSDTVEQYEASTEELKASNEELQAMNEELRSATEELETSREELQSINEELTTVNHEMKGKVDELAHTNSDLQNLMASTSIATVFLDRSLVITRYTPTAVDIFHLIPTDIGRPLSDLKHRLDYPELIDDAKRVLQTLVPVEREVRDSDRWYLARLQPYRTLEDHIAGAVLALIDVSERKQATEAMQQSESHLRAIVESAKDFAIFSTDRDRRVNSWNAGAETIFGYSDDEIMGKEADILFTPEDQAKGDPEREMHLARDAGRADNERWHARKDGSIFYGSGSVTPMRDESGDLRGYVKIMRDLTESKRAQDTLTEHMEELTRFNAAAVGREARMIELKEEINALCAERGEAPRYTIDEQV